MRKRNRKEHGENCEGILQAVGSFHDNSLMLSSHSEMWSQSSKALVIDDHQILLVVETNVSDNVIATTWSPNGRHSSPKCLLATNRVIPQWRGKPTPSLKLFVNGDTTLSKFTFSRWLTSCPWLSCSIMNTKVKSRTVRYYDGGMSHLVSNTMVIY